MAGSSPFARGDVPRGAAARQARGARVTARGGTES